MATSEASLADTLRYIANCQTITLDGFIVQRLRAAATLLDAANKRQRETERLRVLLAWALPYVPEPTPSQEGGLFGQRYRAATALAAEAAAAMDHGAAS